MRFFRRIRAEYGSNRVLRGGSWINDAPNCRAAYRNDNHPANRNDNVGFRLLSSFLRPTPIVYGPWACTKIMTRPLPGAGVYR